jgi:hypothetical protein
MDNPLNLEHLIVLDAEQAEGWTNADRFPLSVFWEA